MEIEVNTERLLWCANEESKVGKNLNQIAASIQTCRKSLQKCLSISASGRVDSAIENAYQRLNRVRADNNRSADALRNVVGIYAATESDVSGSKPTEDQIIAVKNLSTKDASVSITKTTTTGSTITSVVSGALTDIKSSVKTAADFQKEIDDWIDKNIPKSVQNTVKTFYKKTVGKKIEEKYENLEAASKICSKIIKGEFSDAAEKFVNTVGGDKLKMLVTTKSGDLSFNWDGLQLQAVIKSLKLACNFDGYAQKNLSKYEDLSNDYAKQLDIGGIVGSMLGGAVQVLGKGTVDVTCQLASSVLDSTVSYATGGLFTMSSINDAMYDLTGTSPGHIFNSVSNSISDGVDYIVDKGLVEGMSNLGKAVENGVSTSIKAVGSLFR